MPAYLIPAAYYAAGGKSCRLLQLFCSRPSNSCRAFYLSGRKVGVRVEYLPYHTWLIVSPAQALQITGGGMHQLLTEPQPLTKPNKSGLIKA